MLECKPSSGCCTKTISDLVLLVRYCYIYSTMSGARVILIEPTEEDFLYLPEIASIHHSEPVEVEGALSEENRVLQNLPLLSVIADPNIQQHPSYAPSTQPPHSEPGHAGASCTQSSTSLSALSEQNRSHGQCQQIVTFVCVWHSSCP